MKYLIIISLLLGCIISSLAQTTLISGRTILISDGKDDHVYEATVIRTSKDRFRVEIKHGNGAEQPFEISPLRLNTFTAKFNAAVGNAGGPTGVAAAANSANLQVAASALYHNIVMLNSLNPAAATGPKAGDFKVNQKVPVYATIYDNSAKINRHYPNSSKGGGTLPITDSALSAVRTSLVPDTPLAKITANSFTVNKVEIVVHNGFINELRATVTIGGTEYLFTNPIPIGISSNRNISRFNEYYIRCHDPIHYRVAGEDLFKPKGYVDYIINLKDLLEYIPDLTRNVLDKSPQNGTHIILVKQDPTVHTVYKEPLSRIIQAAVFSDFMGIEEDKPNGLIQTDIYRRINLHTIRNQLWGSKDINWGIFQYLRPNITISKVEDKERVLPLDYLTTTINGQEKTHGYATSIDLHLYQYMRVGSLFNLALFQNPHLHTTVEFNSGFYFGLVPLKDSLRLNPVRLPENNEYTAVTLETFLEANIKFSMDKYFGFSMSYTPFLLLGLGEYYNQVKDRDDFRNDLKQGEFWDRSLLGKAELLVWLKPAPNKSNGRFFGRYRFIHQFTNANLYYHQIQVGYSFYLEIPRPKS